jgi:hypothetical protein
MLPVIVYSVGVGGEAFILLFFKWYHLIASALARVSVSVVTRVTTDTDTAYANVRQTCKTLR